MKSLKQSNEKGFTIIEVVLVLAIAGLIFLIVFLALPALQRSRRDTQRKNDAGRAMAALESFAGNNNGAYPADSAAGWNAFAGQYLTNGGQQFGDPETGTYVWQAAAPTAAGQIQYQDNAVCGGGGTARNVQVSVFQESGGAFCQDNR